MGKKRVGRPRKPAADKRQHQVKVTLTSEERRELLKLAEGTPIGAYLRKRALGDKAS